MADDLYDELTRRRIDRRTGPAPERPRAAPGRQAIGGGALLAAVALGIQEVLEPSERDPIVEEIRLGDDVEPQAVTLVLVPGAPRLSRAFVRPWLL